MKEVTTKATKMPKKEAVRYLTDYSISVANKTNDTWNDLSNFLLVKFMDGNIKQSKDGKFIKNRYGLPVRLIRKEYPDAIKRQMIKENPNLRYVTDEELKQRK